MPYFWPVSLAVIAVASGCARARVAPARPPGPIAQAQLMRVTAPRSNQAAILMRDGRVLICGGGWNNESGGVLASAEMFDPRSGFAPTGSMHARRAGHTLTLLKNGKVLVVGGIREIGYHTALSSAELYDPASGEFAATGSMSTAREGHAATLLQNVEFYQSRSNAFAARPSASQPPPLRAINARARLAHAAAW